MKTKLENLPRTIDLTPAELASVLIEAIGDVERYQRKFAAPLIGQSALILGTLNMQCPIEAAEVLARAGEMLKLIQRTRIRTEAVLQTLDKLERNIQRGPVLESHSAK